MLLYTIVPYEQIFDGGAVKPAGTHRVEGGLLELDENAHISRLISTDPRMYLEARYAPGSRAPGQAAEAPSPGGGFPSLF